MASHSREGSRHVRSISDQTAVASDAGSESSTSTARDPDFDASKELSIDKEAESDTDSLLHVPISPAELAEPVDDEEARLKKKKQIATWSSLPRKGQLALLTISRLSEPLTQTSLQSYMFYQLKNFDPTLPDSTISAQAGMMQAAFTVTQFITAIAWGRAADNERIGRKTVLMIGLMGTMVSALGFGFSKSFVTAMIFRSLGGALNGNVGVMRTMISEIIREKKFQSRAFMVLPMTFNIGVIIGPILGGILSDPVNSYPGLFGPGSFIGGADGVWWMRNWPYALPNLVSAMFLTISFTAVFLGLEETHELLRDKPDLGRRIFTFLKSKVFRREDAADYTAVPTTEQEATEELEMQEPKRVIPEPRKPRPRLAFRRIWTRNVIATLAAHGVMAMHVGTFNNVWFLFLSTPRFDPQHPTPPGQVQSLPFHFNGGLAMPPAHIGLALSILGFIGIFTQLFLYPRISSRLGVERSYRTFLMLFPFAYIMAPYLSMLPSFSPPPQEASGPFVWIGIVCVLAVQVMARTFALPSMTILVNNSCPHPSVLGTLHGIAQSISSGMRTIGPAVSGWLYGRGLEWGVVGTAFWGLACVACVGLIAGSFVHEGSGHEILLDGEEEEFDEYAPRNKSSRK